MAKKKQARKSCNCFQMVNKELEPQGIALDSALQITKGEFMTTKAPALTRLEDALDLIERLGLAERVISVNLWNPTRIQLHDVADVDAIPGDCVVREVQHIEGLNWLRAMKVIDGIEVIATDVVRSWEVVK